MEDCKKCQKRDGVCAVCVYDELKYCRTCKLTGNAVSNFDKHATKCKTCLLGNDFTASNQLSEAEFQGKNIKEISIEKNNSVNSEPSFSPGLIKPKAKKDPKIDELMKDIVTMQKLKAKIVNPLWDFLEGHCIKIVKQKGYNVDEGDTHHIFDDISDHIVKGYRINYNTDIYTENEDNKSLCNDLLKYLHKKYPSVMKVDRRADDTDTEEEVESAKMIIFTEGESTKPVTFSFTESVKGKQPGTDTMVAKIIVIQKLKRKVRKEFRDFLEGHSQKIIKQKEYCGMGSSADYAIDDVVDYILNEKEIDFDDGSYVEDAHDLCVDLQKYLVKKYPEIINGVQI